MAKVFLSYARSDEDVARTIADDLRQFNQSVWFDQELMPGDDWHKSIFNAIHSADAIVVLLSPSSLRSSFVSAEWNAALKQSNVRVIPALIDGVRFSDLPAALRDVQGVDLSSNYDVQVRKLVESIDRASASQAPPIAASIDIEKITNDIKHKVIQELRTIGTVPSQSDADVSTDDKLIFVITSFRPDMEPIFEAISAAAAVHGLRAERVKDVAGDYRITETMLLMLRRARLIVADLTHERPNVYFELGYARALDKRVITILREGTERHFDVYDWNYISYTDSRPLERVLVERFGQELGVVD